MKARVAVVVQRWASDMAGGAEALAWQYAGLLADEFDVELVTSTARDYVTWKSVLPEGLDVSGPIRVRRFAPAAERDDYFFALHRRARDEFDPSAPPKMRSSIAWTTALQEELIRAQGPWCPGLVEHLYSDAYEAIVFCTYLYPTTYFPVRGLPRHKLLLAPTLHDEAIAHLPVFRRYAERIDRFLWLTEAERALGTRLWGVERGEVVGMAIDDAPAAPETSGAPYLLYCGRIDLEKNCGELLEWFAQYRSARPGTPLCLRLTGTDVIGIGQRPGVEYLGFVDDARKRALMAGALAFVQPSRHESFSIVALEAMAQGAPIVVNGDCAPLVEHVRNSGSGQTYRTYAEFERALDALLTANRPSRDEQSRRGKRYVAERYARESVRERLAAEVRAVVHASK